MKDDKGLIVLVVSIVLVGAVAIGSMVIPRMIEDSKIPVTQYDF